LLRAAKDPETGAEFSRAELRDQVATLILAGHETTAVTLFWAIVTLAQKQAETEQDAVASEARAVPVDPHNPLESVPRLIGARAVINETLRLYPPAFTVVREAIGADRVGPFPLPPGSVVMIAPWVLHRHRRLWAEPDAFMPSRFLPDRTPPARFAFMPFGAGPRICVGAQFAMTEAVLALSALVGHFRFHRLGPVSPAAVITTQPDHAAHVNISVR
jgi:cytochrome P450